MRISKAVGLSIGFLLVVVGAVLCGVLPDQWYIGLMVMVVGLSVVIMIFVYHGWYESHDTATATVHIAYDDDHDPNELLFQQTHNRNHVQTLSSDREVADVIGGSNYRPLPVETQSSASGSNYYPLPTSAQPSPTESTPPVTFHQAEAAFRYFHQPIVVS